MPKDDIDSMLHSAEGSLRLMHFNICESILDKLKTGDPWAFMTIYHYILFCYNDKLSNDIGMKINPHKFNLKMDSQDTSVQTKLSSKMLSNIGPFGEVASVGPTSVKVLYDILFDIFGFTPAIDKEKFIEPSFHIEKMNMLLQVIEICEKQVEKLNATPF